MARTRQPARKPGGPKPPPPPKYPPIHYQMSDAELDVEEIRNAPPQAIPIFPPPREDRPADTEDYNRRMREMYPGIALRKAARDEIREQQEKPERDRKQLQEQQERGFREGIEYYFPIWGRFDKMMSSKGMSPFGIIQEWGGKVEYLERVCGKIDRNIPVSAEETANAKARLQSSYNKDEPPNNISDDELCRAYKDAYLASANRGFLLRDSTGKLTGTGRRTKKSKRRAKKTRRNR